MEKMKSIWMDGCLVPWDDARVHVLTHALHYGLGVFEGIRCYRTASGTAVFRLREHTERLFASAKICLMKIPYSIAEVERAILDTIRDNGLEEGYIRPLAFVGAGSMGLFPGDNPIHLSIAVWPWGAYLGDDGINNGIRVKTSSFTRHHVNVTMTRAKVSGAYVNSILAKREAIACGYDEALLLDPDGYVAEGSGENIFIVRKGVLRTPPLNSVLEGITRESIITFAREEGVEVSEERMTRDDVYTASEAFFTGTAAEITPIRELDGREIGPPGVITKKLQERFFAVVRGESDRHRDWLTVV